MSSRLDRARSYAKKWAYYEHNTLPWNRLAIHREFMRREAFVRWPVHGNVLQSLRKGRFQIGKGALLEPGCWISIVGDARFTMGEYTALNRGVFVSCVDEITIGDHSKIGNFAFVTDGVHRHADLTRPFTWQGMRSRGPTRIGENVWVGVGTAILGGVSIGDRSIIGANSVVTRDVPPYTIAAGVPARVVREIDFEELARLEARA